MTHKHHERGDGEPQIGSDDVFVLVRNPLGKVPTYFVGHTTAHGVHEVPSRVAGKRMDSLTARAWSSFLEKAGHSFFVAVHHEPPPKKSKPTTAATIPKVLFQGSSSGTRRYY